MTAPKPPLARLSVTQCYICQFCGKPTLISAWGTGDKCPECGRQYDAQLAQDGDDED